jgi:hypothetical protein
VFVIFCLKKIGAKAVCKILVKLFIVQVSPNVSFICLPPDVTQTFEGVNLTISGWGRIKTAGIQSPALKGGYVIGWPDANCSAAGYAVTDNMICAASPGFTTDTCQGDSGGEISLIFSQFVLWVVH